ncbi:MAG: SUMF1/EgtB/PvdO family nonheme iron enzyme [Treponema sp.]|nr:SUMF1/EgtB/PvdO family nonheme iron enzyme [Treponema sp.]
MKKNYFIGVFIITAILIGACYNPFFPPAKEKTPDPTYGISLSVISNHNFGSIQVGYPAQEPKEITITNTGNQPTGSLTVSLSGDNPEDFALSKISIPSIAENDIASFTVVPNLDLSVDTYTAVVTATGGNGIYAWFTVEFDVSALPVETYTVTYDDNGSDSGNVPVDDNSPYSRGTTVTVLSNTDLVKADHDFIGWNTEENGTGEPYAGGDTFEITEDTVLYAQWAPLSIVSINEDPQIYTFNNSTQAFEITGTPSTGFDITYNQGGGNVTPLNAGSYNVEITRAVDGEYAAFSTTITNGLIINKADLDVNDIEWPAGLTANLWTGHVVGAESIPTKLSSIDLDSFTNNETGSFAWDDSAKDLTELGLQPYNVTFTSFNENYNTATDEVQVRVLLGVEMVKVDGGSYMYGRETLFDGMWTTDGTLTTVETFNIGKYQVTQEQWIAVMDNNFSYFHGGIGREPAIGEIQRKRPVEMVTWFDVIEFCNKLSELEGFKPAYDLDVIIRHTDGYITAATVTYAEGNGYRLPEERQWEFAAKGGIKTVGYGGTVGDSLAYTGTDSDTYLIYSGSNNPDDVAWYFGKAGTANRTHEVGLLAPNELDLYDMSGNVWEWCWDTWGLSRVMRGGSLDSSAVGTQSASRSLENPGDGVCDLGFRLVRPSSD